MAATSGTDAWAAGVCNTKSGTAAVLVLHWNGRRWCKYRLPAVGSDSWLSGISAVSSRDAWAAGWQGGSVGTGTTARIVILHWNGTHWTRAMTPNPGNGNFLTGISAVSATDA